MTTKQWTPPRNWRYMAGMRLLGICGRFELRIENVDYGCIHFSGAYSEEMAFEKANERCRPDLEDPATLGCLLALVREAWDDGRLCTVHSSGLDMRGSWSVWFTGHIPQKAGLPNKWFGTEAEALIAALEAAP